MVAARALITHLHHKISRKRFLHREAPLFDVLRMRARIQRAEADDSLTQNWRSEIKAGEAWDVIITLKSFRKDIRRIVALIAPGVHVHRRKEDAESATEHDAQLWHLVRKAEAWSEIQ